MGKMVLLFGLLLVITLISGQSCTVMAQSATQSVPPGLKGEWRVVTVNCLDILAEKDGVKQVFVYKPPEGFNPGFGGELSILAKCQKVQLGWTIFVESESKYSFFPPQDKASLPAKPKTPAKSSEKKSK